MSGLDKMKSHILDEANHSAEVKITEARAKAEDIMNTARAEADTQVEKISKKASADSESYAQRIASSNEMLRKQALLRAKQDVIAGVLNHAYDRIMELDVDAYFDMIRRMLEKYALSETGTICFSAKDLDRMPAGFEAVIQKAVSEKGGSLTLSKEAKEIEGGFILVYGGIEENCTIKALFDAKRDELSDKVHGLLF